MTITTNNTQKLFQQLICILTPPPKLTISEWADKYRVLSSEESASPGQWHNDFVPYMVEPMNAISDPFIKEVVLMCAAQTAKTNVMMNTIGYYMDSDPCPIMLVEPTIEVGESISREKIAPMLRDTPVLRKLFPDDKAKTTGNTIKEKSFPGGFLVIAGANSASSLKSRSIRILLFDEVDEAPADLGGQGDPIQLAHIRTTGFPNSKSVLASTPTIKGNSRIETAYNNSTKERWEHECPSCSGYSEFSWERLQFDTLHMACPYCEETHPRRDWMKAPGKWFAEQPDAKSRGFRITALDSPMLTWQELVDEWVEAQRRLKFGDTHLLKTFINARLAQTWEENAETVSSHALESRREIYNAELPDGVCVLTMGVDVQDNRLAYEVVGWGLGFESWGIEYGEFFGNPSQGEVWNRIDEMLARTWSYANGKKLNISRTAVDTGGHMTTHVYTYCKSRESRGVYAIKGEGGDKVPLKRPGKGKNLNGEFVRWFMVGVDSIKSELVSWLKVGKAGEGYCHFPMSEDYNPHSAQALPINGYDTSYFEMLTAEKKVLKHTNKGYARYEWIKVAGARNEAFDCRVYNRAALQIMSPHPAKMLEQIYLKLPWAIDAPKILQTNTTNNAIEAPTVNKQKKKVDRNAVARQRAVQV